MITEKEILKNYMDFRARTSDEPERFLKLYKEIEDGERQPRHESFILNAYRFMIEILNSEVKKW